MAGEHLQDFLSCLPVVATFLSATLHIVASSPPNVGQLQTGRHIDCNSAALMLSYCHGTGMSMLEAWHNFAETVTLTPFLLFLTRSNKC